MRHLLLFSLSLFLFLYGTTCVYAQTKKFSEAELKLPGKKGACFSLRSVGHKGGGTLVENMPKVKALNPLWNYSWGTERVADQPESIEFVPMVWKGLSVEEVEKRLEADVVPAIKAGKVKKLLGFNEPDKEEQGNMSYTKALELWPTLEKLGVPLCSPACANSEGVDDDSVQGVPGTWMRDFMNEADKRGYRVDYIGVHWSGGTNAESFKVKLKRIYEKYGKRPLLITEFAPADWKTGGDITKHKHKPEAVLAFMKDILPWMEEQDWIAGYSWFSFKTDSAPGASSALFDKVGNLTACGEFYRSVTPQNPKGDQTIQVKKEK